MRYMLLIYSTENAEAKLASDERQAIMDGHFAVIEGTTKAGIFRGAEPLHPTSTATTVRIQNGQPVTTDGPFAETKEQLGGYYILDCKDLDEAISWASKLPTGCKGGSGCVEIRPIMDLPQRERAAEQVGARAV
jgi:hypothetical protein